MTEILSENPILLLFLVASIGYLIGSIEIKKSSLGVAAILFTGLAFGALNPNFQIPEIIFLIGLSIYIYSIGLSSGPAFFTSYKKNGLRDFGFIFVMLLFSGILAYVLSLIFGFSAATLTGIYTGSTTNTPALAGVIDLLTNSNNPNAELYTQDLVVGYTYSYPMGVLGGMIAIVITQRLLKINFDEEQERLKKTYPVEQKLGSFSIEIQNDEICGISIRNLLQEHNWNIVFGRIYHNEKSSLANYHTEFSIGDIVMAVGNEEDILEAAKVLGAMTDSPLAYDRTLFDARRIFVSNPSIAGRTIASLDLSAKYDTVITRIRRGDLDMLATGETILELGDRIRFIARREDLDDLSDYFGDSYLESSRVNLFSFGLGIGLGLLLGSIQFNLGILSFKLGYAGGPLIVGLMLGALRRTGPIVWTLPYSATVTLKQIGLILLLSAIGVRSGNAFVESFSNEGLSIFLGSAFVSLITAFSILLIGYRLMKIPYSVLMGMVANQPAILEFATSRSQNRIPEYGFTMMFPIAMITKILLAQILFLILSQIS
ncbi:MAG: TrkA C-terminal domain-containing protein [Bacteroidota bacterium]